MNRKRWVRRTVTLVTVTAGATAVAVLAAASPASADSGSWFHNLMHKIRAPHDELHRGGLL
ncbi:hypothetical protein [Actinoplanes sp. G11-F43]|uniref:hypothetical protein n=1 Tax=Actinoplanes sp. G11-F43 TaxID=3424130 RepID=UPI003D32F118